MTEADKINLDIPIIPYNKSSLFDRSTVIYLSKPLISVILVVFRIFAVVKLEE